MSADDLLDGFAYHAQRLESFKITLMARGLTDDEVLLMQHSTRQMLKLREELRTRLGEKN